MMQRLANDPLFWAAVSELLGLLYVWAKAKTAEFEAKDAKGTAQSVAVGQGTQQQTLVQHTAAIAALQATGGGGQPQASGSPVVPAAPSAAPMAPLAAPLEPESMAPGAGLIIGGGG